MIRKSSSRRRLAPAAIPLTLLLLLVADPVLAAEGAADDTAAAESVAGEGPQAAYGNEIVVTARRRSETAQDVPIAISVVGGDQIDSTGSFNVGRLQQLAPTLQFYTSNPRNSAVNIRGIGAPFGLTNDGIEQGVGMQGTLYGKNTTAGAINITTNQPTFDFEGKAELSIGDLNFKQAKAAISGPLSDRLAARIAVSATSRRGTIYNVTTDRWIQSQDNIGLRGQLLWKPTDTLSITLVGDWNKQDAVCCGSVFVRTGATQRPLARQYAALAAAQGYIVPSTNPFDRLTDLDANLNAGNEIGGVALRAKWDVGPGTLTSITAWRYWDWQPENDRDFTGLPIVTKSQNPSQQNQYTQEVRYNVSGDRFDFVLGGFAFHQRIDTQGTEAHGAASSRWTLNPTSALANDPTVLDGLTARNTQYLKNTSLALFGQLSWKITDRLTIQPGARINYDKKDGYYQRLVFAGDGSPVTRALTGPVSVARLGVFAPQEYAPSFSGWNFSYDLTATYKPARGVLVYATYAKTFKSGGINQNGVPTDGAGNPLLGAATIRPEAVDHYEAGLKTEYWDGKGTFNVAIFRTDIGDYQANVNNGQFGVLRGYLANADKVRTQGIEADVAIRPSERFNAYVNGAYTDAKYRRFVDAPCPPELSGGTNSPANCDISGARLPGVSKWALSFGAEANVPASLSGQEGQVYLGAIRCRISVSASGRSAASMSLPGCATPLIAIISISFLSDRAIRG